MSRRYARTVSALSGGCRAELRKSGRGERNSARTYQLTYLIDAGGAEPAQLVLSA